mmetsp:Transcript_3193/g.9735  ORF Transcript_3193/g.9735 Transcript_3193/m.9735 type:complete len:383 (+) Transcript_3193:68-1216(+)|eukprot:CAMPEP_0198733132 /NCGR_PEP_ID=MMETSP1475-20131203/43231_1 /TAXON_ID= ORGANISM="Unidentified sp., Strain CCMP1999" /NCGR_SAMPLE_ID=MMETSP1475 /ASSEMBLY_ACC=CAM_ASM_001111 /LENGTH=382 /DNA_ID=CAMNT_0044496385 /DNA_START=66 /DNA_END=1214 /DNA_ORIENTATION=-
MAAFIGNLLSLANNARPVRADVARQVIETSTVAQRTIVETEKNLKQLAVESYRPREFRPIWWLRNKHAQTIAGLYLPRFKPIDFERERVETGSGAFYDVDTHRAGDGKSVVVLCHGLESCARGPHTLRIGQALAKSGHTVAAMNFRGCSGDVNRVLQDYHLGFTDDVYHYIRILSQRLPSDARIYLSGFSLGANVVLKFLGERSEEELRDLKVHGAAVQCVPFDPVACQVKLDSGFTREVYSKRFLASLKKKAAEKAKLFPGAFDLKRIEAAESIAEFDDAFVAPIFGFKSNIDYYQKCDTKPLLRNISVPTLVINALDDPLIERRTLPTTKDLGSAPVRLVYTKKGGHLGFIQSTRSESYTSAETARFLTHVDAMHRSPRG